MIEIFEDSYSTVSEEDINNLIKQRKPALFKNYLKEWKALERWDSTYLKSKGKKL